MGYCPKVLAMKAVEPKSSLKTLTNKKAANAPKGIKGHLDFARRLFVPEGYLEMFVERF